MNAPLNCNTEYNDKHTFGDSVLELGHDCTTLKQVQFLIRSR